MNSFAALMGSLTGAGISGTVGAGASGTSEGGMFASLLEANGAANPLTGDAAGAGLKATLAGKDGAFAPGTIDLATLLQATTDADGNILATDIVVEGAPLVPAIQNIEGEDPPLPAGSTAKEEEQDAGADGDLLAGAAGQAAPDQQDAGGTPSPGTGTAGEAMQGKIATNEAATGAPAAQQNGAAATAADVTSKAPGPENATGQEIAAANRPAHAQPDAVTAPGLNGASQKAGAAQMAAQPAAAALQSTFGSADTADPQQAAKAAHIAANVKIDADAGSGTKRPTVIPADGETASRADLNKPAEIARTITLAPNSQTVFQIIKSGKTDTGPAGGIDQSTSASVQVRTGAAPLQPGAQLPQAPLNGIAVHIAQQAANGARRFDIRLDPPELGRVEVRLDVSKDGKVSTHLVVERSETLDLLQRDARALERALQNAGLDTSDGGMKFSLRDQGSGEQAHSGSERHSHGQADPGGHDVARPSPEIDNAMRTERRYLATGGLDIKI